MKERWDRIFSRLEEEKAGGEDDWLQRWLGVLEERRGSDVLDLGCGAGQDTRFLLWHGYSVVAADFSEKALDITRREAPGAKIVNADLTRALPFPDARFGAIVASLSLHYFPWEETVRILQETRRCIEPGGYLLARLNSTRDPHYSAAEKRELEDHFYLVDGMPRRLFDRPSLEVLFEPRWTILDVREQTTGRYGGEKTLWEIVARNP